MADFIKFWNKLKYWQKGAMIGFALSSAFAFLSSFWVEVNYMPFPFWLDFIVLVVYIIPATIAGSIIGWIIGKFIKK